MKALILSGGTGTRLRPFSHSLPKQLMPIANLPVLEHVLADVRDLGVTEVGVVVGERAPAIEEALGDGSRLGVRITYIPQTAPLGLAHCVEIARDFLGDEDFVMYLGDNVLPGGVAQVAEDFRTHRPAAQIVVHKVADPRAFGVAETEPDGTVTRLVEKPEHPRSDLAMIGVYFFTPAIHEAVRAIEPSARGELEITDAIQWLVTQGLPVRAGTYTGYWCDAGRVADVLACNRELLDARTRDVRGQVDDASRLVGEVVVEAGARITGSYIEGPVVIGAGSVVADSHIGAHTSIGRSCVIREARLGYSIALDGASVIGVKGLHASVIGRSATVTTSEHPSGLHGIVIGDHSRVEIAPDRVLPEDFAAAAGPDRVLAAAAARSGDFR
ncbi:MULTISPECIES: glucose-1-phosphate thymidylyltransferase [Streptomyces]|uniref:Glucose-1-phosphate thymidylyltransferase n=1 Tax=Streptomyces spororaveus TaxID=284039 RepID=A0ABQ3T9R3_9ACTN|nr:glucose-1-phosphate thymidylyltransferase [Streptomyces spororaveus]MCM9082443.1 glucose-1-phosphate thymidylyltransferase [Streptomyces spororaveus]GHI77142.1 glucose-1-phosphate thymidylyltransferase [Streptomyces spororaveus]